ncbi:hypothetical protein C1I95_25220 [Micromonospora craterilacus]|uniref:Uncharacterized protein n=1 Tax=Micromonospora craterilacus TaxID=1655439 RepID=A0A2W2FAZ0_9ACTN|nr:hypothetical protein C1I95_25220 [Micromonospora craterilacus]
MSADLIDKIVRLADDGDGDARTFQAKVEGAQSAGLAPASVKTMQEIERGLLDLAVQFELIDAISQRELNRLREDRHLCAHPSLRSLGEAYDPRPETARAHLAIALDALLTQPPSQGRRVLEEFKQHLCDPLFAASPTHITATFLHRTRRVARRKIVDLAVKHAIRELPPDLGASVDPITLADRMAQCVHAFADADRDLIREILPKSLDHLATLPGDQVLRAVARLGDLDVFWEQISDPIAERLDGLVDGLAPTGHEALPDAHAEVLAMARVDLARQRLPRLQGAVDRLGTDNRATVMARKPHQYFVRHVPQLLAEAGGWRQAEHVTRLAVIPYGPLLDTELLDQTLTNWAANKQCRTAGDMLQHAVDLHRATTHLGAAGEAEWRRFLNTVRTLEDAESYYRYVELEAAMA